MPYNKIGDVSKFKAIVTGDSMKADVKYHDRIDIKSYCKHVFTTNSLPPVNDTSEGFYRRLNILLFEKHFDTATSKFNIKKFLEQDNLDYLGTIGIKAYQRLLKSNRLEFANSEESRMLLENYKQSNDSILSFLKSEEYQERIYNRDVKSTDMWLYYKTYCTYYGIKAESKHQFYRGLVEKYGFNKKIINGYDHYFKATQLFDIPNNASKT